MISFALPIKPVAKGRPRFSKRGGCYTPNSTRVYERRVRELAAKHKPKQRLTGPLQLTLDFFLLRPASAPQKREYPLVRPDLDNYIKAVMDALADFWRDDAQIVQIVAGKHYAEGLPGILVVIEEL